MTTGQFKYLPHNSVNCQCITQSNMLYSKYIYLINSQCLLQEWQEYENKYSMLVHVIIRFNNHVL